MSLTPNLPSYLRTISGKNVRSYAVAATRITLDNRKPNETVEPFIPREAVQTSNCNGVAVSTVETNQPVAKLAVYFRAGSRYEDSENQGVVHALRIASGLGTKGTSKIGITRHIQQAGGNLYCSVGREHIAYTLEATRDKIEKLQQIFKDVTVNQVFKHWELSDALPRFKYDLNMVSPEVRVVEMLHRAAFRRGLGNSLYSPRHMVGRHSSEMLAEFVKKNFVEASVVGIGLPHDTVSQFTQGLGIVRNDNPTQTSKFSSGGDIRKEVGGNVSYVAIALEGAKMTNQKEALAAAVAQRALGSGPRTKRGGNSGGKLASLNTDDCSATAMSASYSDSGLLGALVIASPSVIARATKRAAGMLCDANYTDADVARGKNILKADFLMSLNNESSVTTLEEALGMESLLTGSVSSQQSLEQVIDSITKADVNNIVKKAGGKLSMAAFGNTGNVPYLNELSD